MAISDLTPVAESERRFDGWLAAGYHGDMAYLARDRHIRRHPRALLDGVSSAICVALNYRTPDERDPRRAADADVTRGRFSILAQRGDYHRIVETMLAEVDAGLKRLVPGMRSLACVDTRPVAERSLAIQSGLGWLGKNTCLFAPGSGSWVVLGVLLTDLRLEGGKPLESRCGDCTLCLDACPTGALAEPYVMDARRCISYLTIEKRGAIEPEYRRGMGTQVFGCDICQQICPFNADVPASARFMQEPVNELVRMNLEDLATISNRRFESLTKGSAINRCRPAGMRRNASIALENLSR